MCLVVTAVPVYAFADDAVTGTGTATTSDTSVAETEVLAEIESLRDETTKHFLNSDGSFTAIEYMTPVHFKEKGSDEWTEIDNTLVETEATKTGQETTYKPRQSPLDVTITESDSGNTVSYKDGKYEISWQ
ncbi:MAG: hypothetical protein IJP00_02320, partial [Firmicutes bacterium]|nr:hypothetical protein [Bacillota bacterium]